MISAPLPSGEAARLAALNDLALLDTAPEPAFDALTRLTANLLGVPIAVVSLVDATRQWFKSRNGLETTETAREVSFCAHAILGEEPMVVTDATRDLRFLDNPLVTGNPHIRAYAGVPLRTSDGHAIGTLCVIDREPHDFSPRELRLLQDLADIVRREILSREAAARARRLAEHSHQSATDSEHLYQVTFANAPLGIAVVGLDGHWLRVNPKLADILGRSLEELGELSFQDVTHPDDLQGDLGLVRQLLDGEAHNYTLEKRYLRPDGSVVWANLSVTLVREASGEPQHFIAIVEDITRRRTTEEALRKLRAQLEERVAERTASLHHANEVLAESVRQLKASERALDDSRADLQAVLTNAHDAYICIDGDGLVVEWNRQAHVMFGWRREEVLGRQLAELIIPLALRDAHTKGMDRLARSGEGRVLGQRIELPALRRDGTVIACEVTIAPLASNEHGKVYAAFLHDISERKESERRLAETRERLEDLYERAPCGYYSLNEMGVFVQANETALAMFGCTREEILGRKGPQDFFDEEGRAFFRKAFPDFMKYGHLGPVEFNLLDAHGRRHRVSVAATALRDAGGRFLRSRSVMFDITELHQARQALEEANKQQHLMLDNELVGIAKLKGRDTVWANRAFERIFGYEADELVGQPIRWLYADEASYQRVGGEGYDAIRQFGHYRTQVEVLRKSGERMWVDLSGAMLAPESDESLWMLQDITAMKRYEKAIEEMAFHDALTGLPNRALLLDRLSQAISAATRAKELVAVCFADLDGFKAVNDTHGHEAGDALLREIAARLLTVVRASDTAARLGGDEFVLVLTRLATKADADRILARAAEAIATPFTLASGATVQVASSFGVVFAPEAGSDPQQLVALADLAMYAVKRERKGLVQT